MKKIGLSFCIVVDLLIQLIGGCPQNKGIKPIQKNSIKDETKSQKK